MLAPEIGKYAVLLEKGPQHAALQRVGHVYDGDEIERLIGKALGLESAGGIIGLGGGAQTSRFELRRGDLDRQLRQIPVANELLQLLIRHIPETRSQLALGDVHVRGGYTIARAFPGRVVRVVSKPSRSPNTLKDHIRGREQCCSGKAWWSWALIALAP